MIVELRWGYPNRVGTGTVGIMRATPDTVVLAVDDTTGAAPIIDCAVGNHFTVDGTRWTVRAIHNMPPLAADAPPGSGSGTVVALVESEQQQASTDGPESPC